MKLKELQEKIEQILKQNPEAGNAEVFVDTEARHYLSHMVGAKNIWFDPEYCKNMDANFAYFTLDTSATELIHSNSILVSEQDWNRLIQEIENPSEPNKKLLDAVKKWKELKGN
jgi:hypothetical protein